MLTAISGLAFLGIQAVFTWAFLSLSDKCLKTSKYNLKIILLSPFAAYIYVTVAGGLISAISGSGQLYSFIAATADIIVLALSFLFGVLYSRMCDKVSEWSRMAYMAVYMFFMLFEMAFNWTYSTVAGTVILGIIIPLLILYGFSRHLSPAIIRIKDNVGHSRPIRSVLILAIISALFFVFRSAVVMGLAHLSVDAITDSTPVNIYMAVFTYLILTFLLVGTYTITTNIRYMQTVERQSDENEQLMDDLITSLVKAIDIKDKYTNGHSIRVAEYSVLIAKHFTTDERELEKIRRIALLHDIGKLGIPEGILNKPGKLTDEEYELIKSHTTKGAEILAEIKSMPEIIEGAKYHHERFDGKGYPCGLKGTDIPKIAAIIAVADAYDAMTSKRSYRDVLPQSVARSEIEKNIGKQFHPHYAKVMLDIIDADTEYTLRQTDDTSEE